MRLDSLYEFLDISILSVFSIRKISPFSFSIKTSGLLRNGLRLNLDTKVNDKLRTGIRFSLVDRKQENQ